MTPFLPNVFLVVLALSIPVQAFEPRIVLRNNRAVDKLENKKNIDAYQDFVEGVLEDPYRGELHYNLGAAFERQGDTQKALQEYRAGAELSKSPEGRFAGFFNAARMAAENKQVPQALDLYRKALEIRPDSVETKTNIELLLQEGGGGGGEGQDKKDQSQGKNNKPDQDQERKDNDNRDRVNPKPSPKPFKSEEISQQDVKKIFDEMNRQDRQIRGKLSNKNEKDRPAEKDW